MMIEGQADRGIDGRVRIEEDNKLIEGHNKREIYIFHILRDMFYA